LIDEPEREDWKAYPQTVEQEAAMTNKFKQAFMPFDFTLQ
jgi:pantothenate synthetase